jgi:ketosteroid isomerase-like protein
LEIAMSNEPITQVNATQNAQLARAFFQRFNDNDVAGAVELLADDATWWLAGKPDKLPGVGLLSRAQIVDVFRRMTAQLPEGLRMTVKGTVAEGDHVAVEVESHGKLKNGRVYENQYHLLMRIRGDKIAAVKEYYDSHHVWDTWYRKD